MKLICFYILAYVWADAGPEGSQHTLSFLCIIILVFSSVIMGLVA